MRGRTFENSIIIADETQNSTKNQMKMLLTRISYGSKLIINGDLEQSDSLRNGLDDFIHKYNKSSDENKKSIKIVQFNNNQVQRHSVIKDILNSIKILNNNGVIILHDCLPKSIGHQRVPRIRYNWNGDVWKAVVEARTWKDFETFTILADQGLGIIKKKNNSDLLNIQNTSFKNLKFKFFYYNYKKIMRTVSFYDGLEMI